MMRRGQGDGDSATDNHGSASSNSQERRINAGIDSGYRNSARNGVSVRIKHGVAIRNLNAITAARVIVSPSPEGQRQSNC